MSYMVSVIIPVYNSERYISRCVNSIINQSYKNIEIIIIDDASTDNTADIILSFVEKYNNIKFFSNKKNIGVSNTRNKGISLSTSEYILFLDSDDWLDLNCLDMAINKFKDNQNIDIVIWEIKTALKFSSFNERYIYRHNNILTNDMALHLLSHSFYNEYFLSPLLGCKLFKKDLLIRNNITFLDTLFEDDIFCFLSLMFSNNVALITGVNLYYYQHSSSLSHHFTFKDIEDFFTSFNILYNLLKSLNKTQYVESFYKYLEKCLNSTLNRLECCVQDEYEQRKLKTKLFKSFYSNINVEEYFSFCKFIKI